MPSGKSIFSPVLLDPLATQLTEQARADIEANAPPPDVLRSWKAFADALGTHLPTRINEAKQAIRAIRALS